ncbi:MAG: LytTR family DNA-binding domain-containing protein [Agriterribacter sp.]
MIKSILIDDEKHCLQTLEILLGANCKEVEIIDKCNSAASAILSIQKNKPDLIFLDIEMPGMNGFEMLEQLPEINFAIIFTTGHDQYAIKAIRFSALDYLLKPISKNELINAIKKVTDRQQLPVAEQFQMLLKQMAGKTHQFNKIAVPTFEGFELIPADQIMHCEAADNYTHLFLKNKSKIIACRTLKEIEEQLEGFNFFVRVHHSFLVNLNEVAKYIRGEGGYLVMSDHTTVKVSRSRKEFLLSRF